MGVPLCVFLELNNKTVIFLLRMVHPWPLLCLGQLWMARKSKGMVKFLGEQLHLGVLWQLLCCLMSSNYPHHFPRYTDAS